MEFTLTKHAIERALDMALDGDEIRDAFENPTSTSFSSKHGTTYMKRGRIALAVNYDPDGMSSIVTILWSNPDGWDSDMQLGEYQGRELRDMSAWRAALRGSSRP